MKRLLHIFALACTLSLFPACGGGGGGDDDNSNNGDGGTVDADPNAPDANPNGGPDARVPEGCDPNGPQCNNCIDDDHDGQIDGFDIECTGAIDDDEGSFATGIPGDNMDLVNQDCFFDGDSGAGNDGCNQHICCMLGLTPQQCSQQGYDNNYDPATDCPAQPPECLEVCAPLVPPGCDCFGCCQVCDAQGCEYISIAVPTCDGSEIHDPTQCPTCTQNDQCGTPPCGGDTCILCPGQDPSTLPDTCNGTTTCPNNGTVCTDNTQCSSGSFCSQGCCIAIVN